MSFIKKAKQSGYAIKLLFFWLDSFVTAKERVKRRVMQGGHNIPEDVIERRYACGIQNLVQLYIPVVDEWLVFNNMKEPVLISSGQFP